MEQQDFDSAQLIDTIVGSDSEQAQTVTNTWVDGLEGVPRYEHNGHDQAFISIVVFLMLCLCLSFKNIQRVWGMLTKRLWKTKRRLDYDHVTVNERRTIGLLLTVTVFFVSLIISASFAFFDLMPSDFTIETTSRIILLVTGYFLFQYFIYWLVGYIFTNTDGRSLWIEGFTAAMSILGVTLIIPGLVILFYPDFTFQAICCAAFLYIFARILFICKGFKIFYTNISSLIYFILYLCTLEIIPITIFYYLARLLCF